MKTFVLELTEEELHALADFIGGNSVEGDNKALDSVYQKLTEIRRK